MNVFNPYRLCIGAESLLRQLWILSAGEKQEYVGISQDDCRNRNDNVLTKASSTILRLQYIFDKLECNFPFLTKLEVP